MMPSIMFGQTGVDSDSLQKQIELQQILGTIHKFATGEISLAEYKLELRVESRVAKNFGHPAVAARAEWYLANPPMSGRTITTNRPKGITYAAYSAIEIGMSYEQVKVIIGIDGTEVSSSTFGDYSAEVDQWMNNDGSNIVVEFLNGRVMTKAQAGL